MSAPQGFDRGERRQVHRKGTAPAEYCLKHWGQQMTRWISGSSWQWEYTVLISAGIPILWVTVTWMPVDTSAVWISPRTVDMMKWRAFKIILAVSLLTPAWRDNQATTRQQRLTVGVMTESYCQLGHNISKFLILPSERSKGLGGTGTGWVWCMCGCWFGHW